MSGVQGPAGDMTQAAADELYVAKAGDTMTGTLWVTNVSARMHFYDTASTANTRNFAVYSEGNAMGGAAYDDAGAWQRTLWTAPHAGGFIPTVWVSATRPASPTDGTMGYNSQTDKFEGYVNGAWHTFDTTAI
jgi:hypothetical protein